ncbi:MAG: alpha/beta hydrolase family protein [Cyclobacteriaceae bacterium]
MMKLTEISLKNKQNRPFLIDSRYIENSIKKPVILFIHGFKGFKDWGNFNLMADFFAAMGFVFVKMNFSMNGTTPEHPQDFVDLEAFGNNNFSTEMDDIEKVIDHLFSSESKIPSEEVNLDRLFIMGHSRGGATVILKSAEELRIKAVVTLAAVSDLEARFPDKILKQWQKEGVWWEANVRTGQKMPLYYQIVEDFQMNSHRFEVLEAAKRLAVPMLAIHGTLDETVSIDSLTALKKANANITTLEINNADHTFGGSHPYSKPGLPTPLQEALIHIVDFLKKY